MVETNQLLRDAKVRWRIAFCVWFIIVTTATHWPALAVGDPVFVSPDKLFHFVSFGVLAFTFWCAGWVCDPFLAVRLMLGWVMLDEVSQAMMPIDRPFSWPDVIASTLGVFAAYSWMGTMSMSVAKTMRDHVTALFAQTRAWLVLCPLAIGTTLIVSAGVWSILWFGFRTSQSSASLCVGLLVAVLVLLKVIVNWCQLQKIAQPIARSMVNRSIVIGILSCIVWYAASTVETDQWMVGLTCFTIGCSRAWRSVIGDKTTWKSM